MKDENASSFIRFNEGSPGRLRDSLLSGMMGKGIERLINNRYRRILGFFAILIVRLIWWDLLLPRIGFGRLSRRTRPERLRRAAHSFRLLAVKMGGVLIKVGQFLSSRLDVMPREVTGELAGLQDEVPPESYDVIRQVIEAEFSLPLAQVFSDFESAPLASASIGQVHRARIRASAEPEGERTPPFPVVVKVQRPDIPAIVETDLSALRVVSNWVKHYPPIHKRANIPALLEEFSRSLHEEIDYLAEGKNAETFASNFKGYPGVRVPGVSWEHTTRRVLTLEDVWAIKITDYTAIERAGISRAEVAQRLFHTYLKQIFEDHFFHADPHPGNLFVFPRGTASESDSVPWDLVFVDFGMVGRITPTLFAGLREMLIGVGLHDSRRVVKAYQMLDVLLPGANTELLEKASARVFDSFWGKTTQEMMRMKQEEADQFIHEFGALLYEMPFQVPENLILLGRCVGILSGMCTGLDPDFNGWTGLAPYAQKLVQAEAGSSWQTWLTEIGNWVRVLISLPGRAETLLDRIEQGRLEVRFPELDLHIVRLEKAVNRLVGAIILAAFLLGAVQLYASGQVFLAGALGLVAILTLLWILFSF
ncbi:MAG: AarF/UbiB family protein [Anaerolineaceae bacterium]|nr:AarF/UbiB family protein [Anaerolineaceae bacterium]